MTQWLGNLEEPESRQPSHGGSTYVALEDGLDEDVPSGQDVGRLRAELAEEARVHAGVAEFSVTGSLRSLWYEAQRKDESLAGHFRRTGDPFRLGADGLLERQVAFSHWRQGLGSCYSNRNRGD